MSESGQSKVFMFDSNDPEVQGAYDKARATFRYFWREVAWERRRIIPALDVAAVKAPFSDGDEERADDRPNVEHMWIDEVDFDGRLVSGKLMNKPNWLTSVQAGDPVAIPLNHISDWMYVQLGEVYGAFTVNLMRSKMGPKELADHDAAWGLKFGDPNVVRIVPEPEKPKGLKKWFGGAKPAGQIPEEHPMSENMGPSFRDQVRQDPSLVTFRDDNQWTFLHHQALAGSIATVKVLLEAGADVNALTGHGMTPLQLAQTLQWDRVIELLRSHGAR